MKNSNIAFFIPQIGCKHQCIFCNQSAISGEEGLPSKEEIEKTCENAARYLKEDVKNAEIAFFGGSFTAIAEKYRTKYLEIGKNMVEQYGFKGIRCSTRPDAVSADIIKEFLFYRGTSIEIGCQSMNNRVLQENKRGHTKEDVERASRIIKNSGIELGHQIMVGLMGDSEKTIYRSAERLISLSPDTVRIYPTVVIKNTELEKLYNNKSYKPLNLEKAVEISSNLLRMFEENNIKVIRLGLHHEKSLEESIVAGPYHPAFREICESKIFLDRILKDLENLERRNITIICNKKDGSKIRGQKKSNIKKLNNMGYNVSVKENDNIITGSFLIK